MSSIFSTRSKSVRSYDGGACVTCTFRTSFKIRVVVHGEDAINSETWLCVEAFVTFVAIDHTSQPVQVPQLVCETPEDAALAYDATMRRRLRLQHRAARAYRAARSANYADFQHLEVLDVSDNALTEKGVALAQLLAKKVLVDEQDPARGRSRNYSTCAIMQ